MTKYARVVFEVSVEDDTSNEEIVDKMEKHLGNFLTGRWGIDDIEIHTRGYIADECNSDPIITKEE